MDRNSMEALRLDRRLIRRRNWISEERLKRELDALEDSAHKQITLGEAADEAESQKSKRKGSASP